MAETLLAWIWAPVALYSLSFGCGLLAERLARQRLPNALVPPLGLTVVVALAYTLYRIGLSNVVVVPVVLIAALAGVLLARVSLRERLNPGVAGLAALGAYALYLAPVALSGHWTWAGYNFVNDTAANFLYVDQLATFGWGERQAGRSLADQAASTPAQLGYPLGAHAIVALLKPISLASIPAIYQPVIAASAGMAALSLSEIARRAGLMPLAAAVAGLLAVGGGLLYNYALHGGVKEIVVVALLATAVALAREALEHGLRLGLIALAAGCAATILHVFSAAGAPYLLAVGAVVLMAALLWPLRPRPGRLLWAALAAGVTAALVAIVSVPDVVSFGQVANDTFKTAGASTGELGHLLRGLPLEQVGGVWLARDYRGPVPPGTEIWNLGLIVVVGLGALAGLFFDLRHRRPSATLLLGTTALVAVVMASRVSPYADAKLLTVLSPAVVLTAAVGALWLVQLGGRIVRPAGVAGLAALVIGVVWSDGLAYNGVRLAPHERMEAMEDAAAHAPDRGLLLVNEWEEFAKFFMRERRVNPTFETGSPRSANLRTPAPLFGFYYDLDAERIAYVTQFPTIVKRRSPDASRPPSSFTRTYSNEFYEVWRRRAGVRVREHLPLQEEHSATARPSCALVRRSASRAAPGDRIVAAQRPETAMLDTARARDRPPGWPPDPARAGLITPMSPGRVSARVSTEGGRHRVWVRGSFGRRLEARVDRTTAGSVKGVNSPGQWFEAGSVALRPGSHLLELERPGGWISPGNGYDGEIGPLALEPVAPQRLVSVAPARAASLCGRRWDWIELVSGNV